MNPVKALRGCHRYVRYVVCLAWLTLGSAGAQESTQLQALLKEYSGRLLPWEKIAEGNYVDCPQSSVDELDHLRRVADGQAGARNWMFNGMYVWVEALTDDGERCIVLKQPEHSGLSTEEAHIFLSATYYEGAASDAADAAKEKAFRNRMDAMASFGGTDTEEVGVINGYPYRIHFKGIGPVFAPLDRVQRELAERKKEALSKLSYNDSTDPPDPTGRNLGLDLECREQGQTQELAVLDVNGHLRLADGTDEPIHDNWILHISSGKLVTFDDFFTDPSMARARISKSAQLGWDSYFRDIAFLGQSDDEIRQYKARFARAWAAETTPVPGHFKYVTIDTYNFPERPSLHVIFQYASTMPDGGDMPMTSFDIAKLQDILKPEFQHAFEPIP